MRCCKLLSEAFGKYLFFFVFFFVASNFFSFAFYFQIIFLKSTDCEVGSRLVCRCASAREQDSTFTPPASPMTTFETNSISFLDYDDSPKAFVDDWVNETGALPDEGCTLTLNITRECLPSRIAFPDCASWSVPALQVTVEACAHAGFRGTVDGLLDKVRGDISRDFSQKDLLRARWMHG